MQVPSLARRASSSATLIALASSRLAVGSSAMISRGVGGQRAGERDPLALAAAAGRRRGGGASSPRPTCCERVLAPARGPAWRRAAGAQAERDVVERAAGRRRASRPAGRSRRARRAARPAPSRGRACAGRAGERDRAVVGAVEAGDQVQQRRLPAAGRADERVEGAGLERERDAGDGVDGLGLRCGSGGGRARGARAPRRLRRARAAAARRAAAAAPAPRSTTAPGPIATSACALDPRRAQVVGVEADQAAVVDEHVAAAVGAVQLAGQAAVADRHRRGWRRPRRAGRAWRAGPSRCSCGGDLGQQLEDRAAGAASSWPVTSSTSSSFGLTAIATHSAARCCSPPESSWRLAFSRPSRPTRASSSLARCLRLPAARAGEPGAQRDPRADALVVAERLARVLRDRGDRLGPVRGELAAAWPRRAASRTRTARPR